MTTIAEQLHAAVAAVCPITGISIGDPANKATWRVNFAANATAPQRTAANNAVTAFDYNAAKTAEDLATAQQAANIAAFKADAAISNLSSRTPAQIDAFVDANVTDIASARTMFKRILKLLAIVAGQVN